MATGGTSGGRGAARGAVALVARAVKALTSVLAAILVVHILLTLGSANPANPITVFVAGAADGLTLGIGDLFVPASPTLALVLNYGVPAVLWLIIGSIVARLLLRLVR